MLIFAMLAKISTPFEKVLSKCFYVRPPVATGHSGAFCTAENTNKSVRP
jgi:hypothetical protein